MYAAAEREGGPRNGVLTALEDFLDRRGDLRCAVMPLFFGLAVVWHPECPLGAGPRRVRRAVGSRPGARPVGGEPRLSPRARAPAFAEAEMGDADTGGTARGERAASTPGGGAGEGTGEAAVAALPAAGGLDQSLTGRAGMPTTVVFGGTSLRTTAFVPTRAFAPTSISPMTLAPDPIWAPGPIVGAAKCASDRAHGYPWEEDRAGMYLSEAVDDDLPVWNEHAGMHHCRIRDRDLSRRPSPAGERSWAAPESREPADAPSSGRRQGRERRRSEASGAMPARHRRGESGTGCGPRDTRRRRARPPVSASRNAGC